MLLCVSIAWRLVGDDWLSRPSQISKCDTIGMSAFGQKRTCRKTQSMSLLGVKRTLAGFNTGTSRALARIATFGCPEARAPRAHRRDDATAARARNTLRKT